MFIILEKVVHKGIKCILVEICLALWENYGQYYVDKRQTKVKYPILEQILLNKILTTIFLKKIFQYHETNIFYI